jgi:NADPH-dependent ferric siderophore reductase
MSFSYADVVAVGAPAPGFRRIRLRVEDPATAGIPPEPDAAVGVYFGAGDEGRTYTVRHHTGDHIDVDVVVHTHGPGSDWARTAAPGDRVGLDHARSWYRPPVGTAWQLVVCDLAGLPAAARILETAGIPSVVVAEVLDREHVEPLAADSVHTLIPSVGTGNGRSPSRLADIVGDLPLPEGPGYCWFGGEAAEARAVRKHLRGLGWTLEQTDILGYWRSDSEQWELRYSPIADEMFAVYQNALASGHDGKAAAEVFDEALERRGL